MQNTPPGQPVQPAPEESFGSAGRSLRPQPASPLNASSFADRIRQGSVRPTSFDDDEPDDDFDDDDFDDLDDDDDESLGGSPLASRLGQSPTSAANPLRSPAGGQPPTSLRQPFTPPTQSGVQRPASASSAPAAQPAFQRPTAQPLAQPVNPAEQPKSGGLLGGLRQPTQPAPQPTEVSEQPAKTGGFLSGLRQPAKPAAEPVEPSEEQPKSGGLLGAFRRPAQPATVPASQPQQQVQPAPVPTLGALLNPPRIIPLPVIIGLCVVAGVLIGMFWAYNLAPAIVTSLPPSHLQPEARDLWVKLVAVSYYTKAYNEGDVVYLLSQIEDPSGTVQRLIASMPDGTIEKQGLMEIQGMAMQAGAGTPGPQPGGIFSDIIAIVIPVALVILVTAIGSLSYKIVGARLRKQPEAQ